MDELIGESLISTSNALLQEYKKKLASLLNEIDANALSGIAIDPLKLMSGSIDSSASLSVSKLMHSRRVEDGGHYEKNTDKKWYKPWTWFQKSEIWVTDYKTVEYVLADELAQHFFAPVTEYFMNNGDEAGKYAVKQSNKIAKAFSAEFTRLDDVLKQKLSELESYATDKAKAEERIKETEKRLAWLEDIKKQVESILDI